MPAICRNADSHPAIKKNPDLLSKVLQPKAKLTVLLELLNMDHDYCPTFAEHRVIADLLYYAKETGNGELTNLLRAQQAMMNNQVLPIGTVLADIGIGYGAKILIS